LDNKLCFSKLRNFALGTGASDSFRSPLMSTVPTEGRPFNDPPIFRHSFRHALPSLTSTASAAFNAFSTLLSNHPLSSNPTLTLTKSSTTPYSAAHSNSL